MTMRTGGRAHAVARIVIPCTASLLVVGGIVVGVHAIGADSARNGDPETSAERGAVRGGHAAANGVGGVDDHRPGSLREVAMKPVEQRKPVGLSERAGFGTGLVARVTGIDAVEGEAQGPGEIAGPALRVTVELRNTTNKAVPLDGAIANLSYGKQRTPGIPLSGPGVKSFPRTVAAGDTASGRYVYNVAPSEREDIEVTLSYSAEEPTVAFQGAVGR